MNRTDFLTTELVTDVPTSRWLLEQVHKDSLRANMNIGYPFADGCHKVCCVRLDYDVDEDLSVSQLLALASERASFFKMSNIAPCSDRGEAGKEMKI